MERVKMKVDFKPLKKWFDKIPWKSPKVISGSLVALLLLGGGGYYLGSTTSAAYILVNGEQVGIVRSVQEGEQLVKDILAQEGEAVGGTANTHDKIEFDHSRINDDLKVISEDELRSRLSFYIEGVNLMVGDATLFTLPSQEAADNLLKAYEDIYAKADEKNQVELVSFEEEVETQAVEAAPDSILSEEEAFAKLQEGNVQREEYTIQPNDSWWLIARKNSLLTSEVLAANPGTTVDTVIKPGEKITIERVTPYLTVVSEGTQIANETIPFDVVTKTDSSLASGKSKVTQAGSDGEKVVTYSYVKKNDKVVTKTVLDEEVLKEAVTQVVAKGPRTVQVASASRGSGTISGLMRPYQGRTSSYYGYRGGEFHTGIDYSGPVGEPYVAAAAGTVISAGWNGNYGYCILIDHGNGVQTRYAHSSKLLVSAGQTVSKGQTIGLVGATGRATGPHLHFEIIINGDTVNPANYVN